MVKSAVFLGSVALAFIAVAGARAESFSPGVTLLGEPLQAALDAPLDGPLAAQLDVRSREIDGPDGSAAMPILACALGALGLLRLRKRR